MRRFLPLIGYALAVCAVWCADAAFVSFYHAGEGMTFASALWAGVPFFRLLPRLLLAVFLVFWAVRKVIESAPPRGPREYSAQDRGGDLFWGSAESDSRTGRVLYHSLNLAARLKMQPAEREKLRLLCYCYDIGKFALPFYVLEAHGTGKESRDGKDRECYERHTDLGAQIAANVPLLAPAAELIRLHHEYYNGGGIHALKGREIPLACRVFNVVWAFDSMVYPGGRTRALVCDEALLELRYYSGTAFDPEVVEAFIKMMSKRQLLTPLGSREFSWR